MYRIDSSGAVRRPGSRILAPQIRDADQEQGCEERGRNRKGAGRGHVSPGSPGDRPGIRPG
ncbi:MAG: hypothetical protein MZU97_12220 [Bacillus subtilis]|nr:hypothetical protein [Bacillus subtilis]